MDYLILVNRFEPLPKENAKDICFTEVGGKLFENQTGEHLKLMLESALNDGIKINVISGYRSEEYQRMLWETSIKKEMSMGLDYSKAVKNIARTLAPVGTSEHQTGLAVDLGTAEADDVEADFHRTAQGKWLSQNAARFGFILRYPRFKEHITGIDHEPWHYRYVGKEAAEIMKESGICLEEFLHFYSDRFTLP